MCRFLHIHYSMPVGNPFTFYNKGEHWHEISEAVSWVHTNTRNELEQSWTSWKKLEQAETKQNELE